MRSLEQALSDHDLIALRVIAEWWELDLTGMEKHEGVEILAGTLARLDMMQEIEYLPEEEAAALQDLVSQGGRAAVDALSRLYGEVRMMGPGRMEREEPWLDPISPLEALWYRGFLFRGFDDTAEGVLEFYYLPQELLAQFPGPFSEEEGIVGAVVLDPVEPPDGAPAEGLVNSVDDLTTMLAAALQPTGEGKDQPAEGVFLLDQNPGRKSLLLNLAAEQGWLREDESSLRPTRSAVDWLKKGREAQLFELADAWSKSGWNDLCHTPGLICEGHNWQNDPILARTAVLDALPQHAEWYSLGALVDLIKNTNPDFQRPDGNYDTWYVRDAKSGDYLNGFESWELVEGRLISFLITGPMYWLGITVISDRPDNDFFRISNLGLKWLAGEQPREHEDKIPIIIHPDASIHVAHNADRYLRFQVTRIAELEKVDGRKPYHYRVTPASLALAGEQGITAERLLRFLSQASETALPKSLQRAVERWSERGVEGRLESVIVLRVSEAEIIQTLLNNPKTRDFLSEPLGDHAIAVKAGKWRQFRAACAQLGLLIDDVL
jgi:hypothetical protein